MNAQRPLLYIIAGEHSGDQLGGTLLRALKQQVDIDLAGLGGPHMQAEGLNSFFDIEDIAVIGIAEIIPHIRRLKRRIRETADDIERKQPTVVVTIDSPGFCFRVIEILRKRGYNKSVFIHYVAQTVWAYRPRRAEKAKRLLDALMTLFAFEVPYFTKYGLRTEWVGHQAAWQIKQKPPEGNNKHQIVLFPGSRRNELKRHIPLYREVAEALAAKHPSLSMSMPLPPELHSTAHAQTQNWPCPLLITPSSERFTQMQQAGLALCKSGTISLECALSGTPMVITYKANPISAWVVRRTLQTRFVGLPNILLNREAVPELIQENATPEQLTAALDQLLSNETAYKTQQESFQELRKLLLPSDTKAPYELAAEFVASYLRTA